MRGGWVTLGPLKLRVAFDISSRRVAKRMPRLWKYEQLSNCHRHAFRAWLLALKRANLAGLPHRRYSCAMRPLRYSINITLDGCCDHRAIIPDEDVFRHGAENLNQADALLFGRVTYEMMESYWRPLASERTEPFARIIDAAKKYVVSSTLARVDWNGQLVRGDLGSGRPAAQARVG